MFAQLCKICDEMFIRMEYFMNRAWILNPVVSGYPLNVINS